MDNLRSAIRESALGPVKETEKGTWVRSYCFAPDFIGFSGHFPGYPILPAFVQVLMVLTMAEEVKGRRLQVLTLERAKFQKEVFPGQEDNNPIPGKDHQRKEENRSHLDGRGEIRRLLSC